MQICKNKDYKTFEQNFLPGELVYIENGGVGRYGILSYINADSADNYVHFAEIDPDTLETTMEIIHSVRLTKSDLFGAKITH